MLKKLIAGWFICLLATVTAAASPPNVAVDIAPVHSLVSQVMQGVATPDLIIQPGASPHGYSLRPSEARALQRADVVFWVSSELTPWLESPLENLAGSANKVELLAVAGITLHEFREGATFEAHEHHDDEHGQKDEHGHKDEYGHDDHAHKDGNGHDEKHAHKDEHGHDEEHAHKHEHVHDDEHANKDKHGHDEEHAHKAEHAHKDEHGHDEHVKHDEHAHEDEHGHHGHQHGEYDPHAWLDPENAKVWLRAIASELSSLDAANAPIYQRNAANAIDELDNLITTIRDLSKDLEGIKFIVFHDAYQYFERRFNLEAYGAISIGDASDPSPARVKEIRDAVSEWGIRCVFTEPQYNPEMVYSVFENTQVATIGVMDPVGADIKVGKEHYSNLLRALLTSLNQCHD